MSGANPQTAPFRAKKNGTAARSVSSAQAKSKRRGSRCVAALRTDGVSRKTTAATTPARRASAPFCGWASSDRMRAATNAETSAKRAATAKAPQTGATAFPPPKSFANAAKSGYSHAPASSPRQRAISRALSPG